MCKISKVKHALLAFVSVVLVLSLLAALGVSAKREKKTFVLPDTSTAEISSARYTQYNDAAAISGCLLTTEGFKKVLENDNLELWLREEIDSIRVVDKKSGYVWGGLVADEVDSLNEYWEAMANSIFTVEYYDDKNAGYQLSMSDESFECTYEFDDDEDVLHCVADCYDIGLAITFEIALKEDRIEAYVVEGGIEEYDPMYKLCNFYLLPFFGCVEQGAMDGYLFVPDGSGALMRFKHDILFANWYSNKVFGPDAGIDSLVEVNDLMANRTDDYLVEAFRPTIPVYGMVHGAEQYAAMTVISSGEEYATIQASLAASNIPFNWITTKFEYRQLYHQPVSKTNTIIVPQPEINEVNPRLSIYLLSDKDASYSGMAVKYRSVLEEDGVLDKVAQVYEEQIPLRVDVVCSDVKEGFIFDSVQTFTTTDEALEMQKTLAEMGIKNVTMVMSGWQSGGVNAHKYGTTKSQSTVGSISDLEKLRDSLVNAGGDFYLQTRVATLTKAQGRPSYLATKALNKKLAMYMRDNLDVMFPETYLATPANVVNSLQNYAKELEGFNFNTPRLGSELYAHYDQDFSVKRDETRAKFEKVTDKVAKKTNIAMNNPNYYMWDSCTDIFDVPMMSSQYLFESDSVPFLQILLKGHVNYYAPYANQGFYTNACILKTIEYGAYPSFLVMGADNGTLNETPMVDYFSLNFNDWTGTIDKVYTQANAALTAVEGAQITEHKVLQTGVVRVTYDNDTTLYINYNNKEVTVDGVKIGGLNFTIERG